MIYGLTGVDELWKLNKAGQGFGDSERNGWIQHDAEEF